MLLQTVRPNIVQAIRAYRVEDLMTAAEGAGQHFLYANLTEAQTKQDVLDKIAESFLFPAHFGKNLDALFDCMTDLVHRAGSQPGFVVVLEQLPDNARFDREHDRTFAFSRIHCAFRPDQLIRKGKLTDKKIAKYEASGYYSDDFRQARKQLWQKKSQRRGNFDLTDDGRMIYRPI